MGEGGSFKLLILLLSAVDYGNQSNISMIQKRDYKLHSHTEFPTGYCFNLAKLGDGLDESLTVMVGDDNKTTNKNSVKIGAY